MSPSVTGKSSMARRRERSPNAYSHRSRSPSHRERSPARPKSSHRDRGGSPPRERQFSKVNSPVSRSPSPRTKRLRRAQAEKEVEKSSEKDYEDYERHDLKGNGKSKHERNYREKDSEKEASKDRREQRSERERNRPRDRETERDRGRNVVDRPSSRSKHKRSVSPSDDHHHNRSRRHSRSPPPAPRSRARDEDENSRGGEYRDEESDAVAQMKAAEHALETKEKQKPSFELSGKLAEETNRFRGVTLLFNEPPDARKPDIRWRLYVFKGGEVLHEPLYVHRQSCYLFGRERRVADVPTDHPSCSKQHAVLQYRQVEVEQPDGMMAKKIKPYLMDLGSTNKTFINEIPIEPQRYYELFEKDTIKFGNSSREYVLLHENSMN